MPTAICACVDMAAVMTEARLAQLRRDGCGTGRDEGYKAWIRIRRKLSSPVSNLHSMTNPMYRRSLNLLSGLEFSAANVALWLGANEVREQHPFWPEEHPHPCTGRHPDLDRELGPAPGLLDLAKEAGIKHGVYPGTRLPFVATIDFTVATGAWHASRLTHWSCKPRSLLDSAPNRERMLERIELERMYSHAVYAVHVVIDGTHFTRDLITNLDWCRPLRSEMRCPAHRDRLPEFCGLFMSCAQDSIERAIRFAAEKMMIPKLDSEALFRTAAWLGLINIDLSVPIILSRPLRRDSTQLKERLRKELLGEQVCVSR